MMPLSEEEDLNTETQARWPWEEEGVIGVLLP